MLSEPGQGSQRKVWNQNSVETRWSFNSVSKLVSSEFWFKISVVRTGAVKVWNQNETQRSFDSVSKLVSSEFWCTLTSPNANYLTHALFLTRRVYPRQKRYGLVIVDISTCPLYVYGYIHSMGGYIHMPFYIRVDISTCSFVHIKWIYPPALLYMCGHIHWLGGYIHLPLYTHVDISTCPFTYMWIYPCNGWIYPPALLHMGGYIHPPIYLGWIYPLIYFMHVWIYPHHLLIPNNSTS